MVSTVIPVPPMASLPIAGQDACFPLRRVFCVGRNYAAHAREMGHSDKEPPFFFTKPADAVFYPADGRLPYPPATADLHHEVELVVALKSGGASIAAEDALSHVYGVAVGVDLTRRDLQAEAKKAARPWDMAKGFDASGPVGLLVPFDQVALPADATISLEVNGETRQSGSLSEMIWPVADVIAALSKLVTLAAGDIIFTGTPEGVGPVARGETVSAHLDGVPSLVFTME
jgi:fumarylpyruvate hydrolase